MERSPSLALVVLGVTFCCGVVYGQSGGVSRPPVIRPPAIPSGAAGQLQFRAPAPPVSQGPPVEPRPPAPPPTTDRACVVRHVRDGEFKKECIDINARCEQRNCPVGTVCGLNLDEKIECFPKSVKDFENCKPDFFRLSQPCPADAGIRGFGRGCNYCFGANPFLPGPAPPAPRRLHGGGPTQVLPPAPVSSRACVVSISDSGETTKECIDISVRCKRKRCPIDTYCVLDFDKNIQCLPKSKTHIENCGSEEFRLEQPCPADSGIGGFGEGCTFCFGANPFETRSFSSREISVEEPIVSDNVCIVVYIGNGEFKKECKTITAECHQKQCPKNKICGLDTKENVACFDKSVTDFQNCALDEFRLQQPCPADARIRGFGRGCTFCEGGNPFGPGPVGPPRPPPGPEPGQTMAGSSQSIVNRVACVSRITSSGAVRRGCMDITHLCQRRGCPPDRTCALDINEQPSCFAASQLTISNCGTTRDRVAKPCPDGTEVVAFGAGCTYCRPPPTPRPLPDPTTPRRACIVSGELRRCETISARCAALACPETCALGLDGKPACFAAAALPRANCGPERRRLDQPCGRGMTAVAFGAGCTYCRPQ